MPIAATVEHDDDIADAFRALSVATHDAPPAPLENAYHRLIPDIIHARSAPIAQPVTAFNAPSRGQVGMARLDAVVRNVNIIASTVLDRPITKNQQTIVTQFILVCLPTIVTPAEYVQYRDEYYIYLGIDPSEINVPVPADQPTSQTSASHQFRDTRLGGSLMPRQCGKTTIIAICCAAILVACPCVTIGNFASQLQQAEIMQEQIAKNIRCFQDKSRIVTSKSESTVTFRHGPGRDSIAQAFSMNSKVHLLTHVIAAIMPASSIIVPATATATMAIVILFATNVVAGLYALKALRSTDPDSSIVVGLVILDTCLLVSFSIVYFIASRQWHHFIPSSIAAGFLTYNLVSLIFASTADRDAATFLWHVLSIPLGISGIVHITSQ